MLSMNLRTYKYRERGDSKIFKLCSKCNNKHKRVKTTETNYMSINTRN